MGIGFIVGTLVGRSLAGEVAPLLVDVLVGFGLDFGVLVGTGGTGVLVAVGGTDVAVAVTTAATGVLVAVGVAVAITVNVPVAVGVVVNVPVGVAVAVAVVSVPVAVAVAVPVAVAVLVAVGVPVAVAVAVDVTTIWAQVMSACDCATMTRVPSVSVISRALTVMVPVVLVVLDSCSLMTIVPNPAGKVIVWFGAPVTLTAAALIVRLVMVELPLTAAPVAPQVAEAVELTAEAPTVTPPVVAPPVVTAPSVAAKLVTPDEEVAVIPDPVVDDDGTLAVTEFGGLETFAAAAVDVSEPPVVGRSPVAPTVTFASGGMVAERPVALPLYAVALAD